ncbi:MAG: hypothetical protein EOL87_03685 [Spartobacteria bacterium]|nr:hypothetical protein [Spartobacteria bacterium]
MRRKKVCTMKKSVMILVCLLAMACLIRAEESDVTNQTENTNAQLLDPFSYHASNEDGDAFIPADSSEMPKGIYVLAILHPEKGKSYAVIRVANLPNVFYVTEDDVVRVESPSTQRVVTRNAQDKPQTARVEPIYLKIHKIEQDSVQISPQKRPQEIHIFQ